MKPVALALKGTISKTENPEERPAALKSISLRFDRNGTIFTKGLATCSPPSPDVPDIGWGARCPEAVVGHGEVELEIRLPEEPVFRTQSPLRIYNGAPDHGRTVLIYRVDARVPAPTTFVTSGVIEHERNKFGSQTTIEIPAIVGGYGSVTGFRATIAKTWTYGGQSVSLLSARCPQGNLAATSALEFVDGDQEKSELVRKC